MTTSTENPDSVAAGDDRGRRASMGARVPRSTRELGVATDATMMRVAVDAVLDLSGARYLPLTDHDLVFTLEVASV